MKRWVACVFAVMLLASCATLPNPEGPQDSLVVGKLLVDFPEGFFNIAPTTLDSQVELVFKNLSENTRFSVYTKKGGYYCFRGKANERYILEDWSARIERGHHRYVVGPFKANLTFEVAPRKIVYLGHLRITFRKANKISQVGKSAEWRYEPTVAYDFPAKDVQNFIAGTQQDSPWMRYDTVNVRFRTD